MIKVLKLSRETLRVLSEAALRSAHGGEDVQDTGQVTGCPAPASSPPSLCVSIGHPYQC